MEARNGSTRNGDESGSAQARRVFFRQAKLAKVRVGQGPQQMPVSLTPDQSATAADDAANGEFSGGRTVLIVWHSRTGAAKAMAEAAARGAGDQARLLRAADAGPDALLQAGALLLACPENLGTVTGEIKEFLDRCYYPLLGRIEGLPYATMIAAGSDGEGAQRQIDRIVTGWRLRRVAPPLIVCTGAQTPAAIAAPKWLTEEQVATCHDLGQTMAEGLTLGVI